MTWQDSDQKKKIFEIFKAHDKQGNGYLEHEEVWNVMEEIYEKYLTIKYEFCDEDIQILIEKCDRSCDGKIIIKDFVDLM